MSRLSLPSFLKDLARPSLLRAWLFMQVVRAQPGQAAQAGSAAVAALVAAALVLAARLPALHDELTAQQQRLADLQTQLHALPAPTPVPAVPEPQTPAQAAAAPPDMWHWQQLAQGAGLRAEHFQALPKPAGASGDAPPPLQLRLRGRYHAQGAWVAALAGESQAPRLLSYQLQAGEAGLHLAEVQLAPWPVSPSAVAAANATPLNAVPFAAAVHLDPFNEPTAADAWADLPALWRQERERPRQWLEAAPLSELALVGTLQRGGHWQALLRWKGQVHMVREGEYAGPQLGRVQRIDEHGLWLREILRDQSGRWQARERRWRVGEEPG